MIGQTIDRYQIVEHLGQGGMGVVYKARDTVLERFVALKVLPPDKSTDPDRRQRFLNEAQAASALNHPGIVAVYDVLTVDDQDVLVMELVEGETLEELLVRKRLPLGKTLSLGIDIADALARAHAAGIVHRDLKPANVMVAPDGVKLLDFGLAKLVETPFLDTEAPTLAPEESSLTRERVVLGTVGWMSPEQAAGKPLDARSDIFAFGVVMYEMLTGQHPFRRNTTIETLAAIREVDPERPTSLVPTLPNEAERAVLRCLRKDPARRWQSISDLGAVLEDLKEDTESGRKIVVDEISRRKIPTFPLVAAIVLSVLTVAVIATIFIRREPGASPLLEMRRVTYDAGASTLPAISPASGRSVWIRPPRHPSVKHSPSFTPIQPP